MRANLERLHQSDYQGTDLTTCQIKELLGIGYNMSKLAHGLSILRDAPFTTKAVEQAKTERHQPWKTARKRLPLRVAQHQRHLNRKKYN